MDKGAKRREKIEIMNTNEKCRRERDFQRGKSGKMERSLYKMKEKKGRKERCHLNSAW